MSDHHLEYELRAPAPRPVRRRAGHGSLITFIHVFMLPHTLIGLGGVLVLVGFLVFGALGQVVDGTVLATREVVSSKGGRSYPTELRFSLNGREEATSESLRARPSVGSTVPLRVLVVGSTTVVRPADALLPELLFGLFFVGFWNFAMGLAHWRLTVLPLRQRALVRHGVPVPGRLTERREVKGSKGRIWYRLSYDYVVEGFTLSGQMDVRKDDYVTASEGDVLTVLVSEKKPQRSVIYRFAPYEALGSRAF